MTHRYSHRSGAFNVALSSRDSRRSAEFYTAVLDAHEVNHEDGWVQIQTPGARDIAIFHRASEAGLGGLAWFGFQLQSPKQIGAAALAIDARGGEVIEQGELVEGQPYVFARDPDGYMFEVWYEEDQPSP